MEAWIRYLYGCVLVSPIYKVCAQCGGSTETIDVTETYKTNTLQYPSTGTYGQDLDCSWLIQSDTDQLLMYISVTQLANGDVLYIYDSTTDSGSPSFSTSPSGVSGQSTSLVSGSGNFYIRFTSNSVGDTDQLGFRIRFMKGLTDDKGGCVSSANVEATDTKQYLTSPNFPDRYPTSSSCSWTINTKDNCGSLVLDFILLDIEPLCSADSVTVTYDGNAPQLCPSNDWDSTSDYNTTGTTADITLSVDGSDQYHGFVMTYQRTGCVTSTTTTVGTTGTTSTMTTVTKVTTTTTTPSITTATVTQTTTNPDNPSPDEEYIIVIKIVVPVGGGGYIIITVIVVVKIKKKENAINPSLTKLNDANVKTA